MNAFYFIPWIKQHEKLIIIIVFRLLITNTSHLMSTITCSIFSLNIDK
jgi:hypothetical protein